MDEKMRTGKSDNLKKIIIVGLIFAFIIAIIVLFLPERLPGPQPEPAGKIVYVSSNGTGDFNCDGTDDQVEINEALAYAAENPDLTTIHLQGNSTYVISDTILIGSNTILEGDSKADSAAILKLEDEADWPLEKPLITQLASSGNSNIIIRGFEIDGNHDNNTDRARGKGYYNLIDFLDSDNIKVYDMYMHDSHGDGLQTTRCSNIQFYNNTVYKLGHDALYAIYSLNVEAWDNKITCRTNSGLRVYNTNHVKFYNNTINSEGEGGAGIQVQKDGASAVMDDIEIYNNLIYETNSAGIWVTGYGSRYDKDTAKDVHIYDNKLYKTGIYQGSEGAGGIVLNGFQNTLIENNFINECHGAGIAHKTINGFKAPESGYTTLVKNNIIINTESSQAGGKGYGILNKLNRTHSFILENNCLSNNVAGDYMYANSTTDVNVEKGYVEKVMENEALRKEFPWRRALSAGPK
ncbi:MAG: right-handed parallel beta-helix repeat-containing protein [Methanosarcina sp.]